MVWDCIFTTRIHVSNSCQPIVLVKLISLGITVTSLKTGKRCVAWTMELTYTYSVLPTFSPCFAHSIPELEPPICELNALYVTTHNSWQSFEICPTIFSKCSYYMPSGNIAITCQEWVVTYEAHVEVIIQMFQKCSHQSQIKHMLWVHFKCVSTLQALVEGTCHLPANNRLGTF